MSMIDPLEAMVWAVIAGLWLGASAYAALMAHYRKQAALAALASSFFCLFVGMALIGLLRTGWRPIPIPMLKIIERSAFIVAALNGVFAVQILSGRWCAQPTLRMVRWWNHMLEGVL